MSAAHDLFRALADHGVTVWQEAGQLRYKAPSGAMTPDLLSSLRAHKADLIGLLAANDCETKANFGSNTRARARDAPFAPSLLVLTFEIDGRQATCVDSVSASLADAVADLHRQFPERVGRIWQQGKEIAVGARKQ